MYEKPSPQQLREIKFLQDFPAAYLEKIASIAEIRQFDKGDILFDEGQLADKLYLIVSGSVLLQACSEMTGCKPIMTIGMGELMGWSSLTDDRMYAAKGVVVEPLQVVQLDGAHLREICDRDPRFGYEFLRRMMIALSKRLHVTWKQVAEVCVRDYLPIGATAGNN